MSLTARFVASSIAPRVAAASPSARLLRAPPAIITAGAPFSTTSRHLLAASRKPSELPDPAPPSANPSPLITPVVNVDKDAGAGRQPVQEPMSFVKGYRRTMKALSLEDKVCVITGGASGIGKVLANAFIEAGATKVAILDLNEAAAKQAATELSEYWVAEGLAAPGELEAVGLACDVASETSVQGAFDTVMSKWGKIDIMTNSAGIVENFPATEYPTDKTRKLVDINILGSFFTAREAAKRMKKGGSIILIGSMSGMVVNIPQPQTPYNFSKAAVIHMAKSLAVEWAPQGIRVNAISPGYVMTQLTKTILDANTELRDTWVGMTPAGRLADPQDLKGAVVYLGSDASLFTTGSNMVVDGGYTCT